MKKIPILIAIMAGCVLSMLYAEPMTLVFNTNLSSGTTVTLPLDGTVNVTVDWGDGSSSESFTSTGNKSHTYASEGTYTVSISGTLTHFGHEHEPYSNVDKLTEVTNFGDIGLTSLWSAFFMATNLTTVSSTLPSTVTDVNAMFYQATSFNGDISNWDVSAVTNMSYMFVGATAFNQDIGRWDVSAVTNMSCMFFGATAFNQDIGRWDVSAVTNMYGMFYGDMYVGSAFNQDIGSWDVSAVTDMSWMFLIATSFNQDIGGWDVGAVTNMNCMFCVATSFNQNISNWDVNKVTDMGYMFCNATSFNQDIRKWDVSSVTDMTDMFRDVMLSTPNYNALLTGWATQTVKSGVSFNGGNSRYSAGAPATARQSLIDTYGWTITDGGQDASLPVDLNSFSAVCEGQSVILSWITESETDNLGYILERSEDGESWTTVASYQTNEDLKGQGNSSSKTEYTFTDYEVEPGAAYQYRLSDVSTEGEITVYSSLSITLDALPEITEMEKAYPNPFNPNTFISYHLAENSQVKITVFDLLGRQVKTLYSGQQLAGSYQVYWNGKNENNSSAPTGTYLICMQTEDTKQVQKVMLLK